MTEKDVTDEDLCAHCGHLSLIEPRRQYTPGGHMWHAKAVCAADWPFTRTCVEANAISECPRLLKAQP